MAPADERGARPRNAGYAMASTSRTHLRGRGTPDPAKRQFAQVRNVVQASGATSNVGPSGTLESRMWTA